MRWRFCTLLRAAYVYGFLSDIGAFLHNRSLGALVGFTTLGKSDTDNPRVRFLISFLLLVAFSLPPQPQYQVPDDVDRNMRRHLADMSGDYAPATRWECTIFGEESVNMDHKTVGYEKTPRTV